MHLTNACFVVEEVHGLELFKSHTLLRSSNHLKSSVCFKPASQIWPSQNLVGFECFIDQKADCPTTYANYDFAKIASQGGIKEVEVIKEKPIAKKKKVIPVQKKVKVEEEGGC